MDCLNNIDVSFCGKNVKLRIKHGTLSLCFTGERWWRASTCKITVPPWRAAVWHPVLLKISRFLVARDAHAYRMVPATRRYGAPVRRAAVTHALSAGPAVMDGETGVKLTLALITAADILVRNPVRRPRRVFNQTWRWRWNQTYSWVQKFVHP